MKDPSRDVPRAVSGRGEGGVSLVDYGVHLVRKLAFDLDVEKQVKLRLTKTSRVKKALGKIGF